MFSRPVYLKSLLLLVVTALLATGDVHGKQSIKSDDGGYAQLIDDLVSGIANIRLKKYKDVISRPDAYIHRLLEALKDENATTRRIAAEMIERIFTPCPNAHGADRTGIFGEWRRYDRVIWRDKVNWKRHDTLPSHLPLVIPAMVRALGDSSEEVRAYSAIALYKLAPFAEDALEDLKNACEDPSPVVSYWAKCAVEEIRGERWKALRLIAQKIGCKDHEREALSIDERDVLIERVKTARCWDWEDLQQKRLERENKYGRRSVMVPKNLLWPDFEDERWNAALELLRHEYPKLIEAAEGLNPDAAAEARDILDLLEDALDRRLWVLTRFADEDWEPCYYPAIKEMKKMGEVALHVVAYDFLRCPRMSLSDWTYPYLIELLAHMGKPALPIMARGLEHWYQEVNPVALAIQDLGPDALPAIPFILSAWRYEATHQHPRGHDPSWDGSAPNVKEPDCSLIIAYMGSEALPWLERALNDNLNLVHARAERNILALKRGKLHKGSMNHDPDAIESAGGEKRHPAPVYPKSSYPGFSFARDESFSCEDETHTMKIYQHHRTGLEFVLIPGGSFMMGSEESSIEKPVHSVSIEPFLLCRTECTQEAWDRIGGYDERRWKEARRPIESVSWHDCTAWCKNAGLRLPTEAEWEYACRANTSTRYCFGDSSTRLSYYANYARCGASKSIDSGLKRTNAWGLHDMYGNVWEWCQDEYYGNYKGAPTDGSAWEIGVYPCRVNRGGSCYMSAWFCRSTTRDWNSPDLRCRDLGFRPACSLTGMQIENSAE